MPTDLDDMEKAEVEPLWATIGEDRIVLELDGAQVDELEPPLQGVIMQIKENVGENDSRLYFLAIAEKNRPIALYGTADINQKIDFYDLGVGHEVAISRSGETRETGQGDMTLYKVLYSK